MRLLYIDANSWTAIGTWFLVVGTLIAVYIQKRQSRLINSANTILTFHDRFESRYFITKRKNLAGKILNKDTEISDEILVFMETLGCLTRRRVLTKEMVWNEFSWEVIRYYYALTKLNDINYINKLRDKCKDTTLYCDFEWLCKKLLKIDKKKRKSSIDTIIPNIAELKEFIEDEKNLSDI